MQRRSQALYDRGVSMFVRDRTRVSRPPTVAQFQEIGKATQWRCVRCGVSHGRQPQYQKSFATPPSKSRQLLILLSLSG
jgi:hypothetical protein